MSLLGGSLFTETVTIRIPGGPTGEHDEYGLPITAPPTEKVVAAWYEPRGSSEDVTAKEQQNSGYWLYTARGHNVTAQSQVLIEGDWYEVDGEPGLMPNAFLLSGYMSVAVKKVTG